MAARWKCKVAEATGSMLVSITWNFIVGFCVYRGTALAIRVALGRLFNYQMSGGYLGSPRGLMSIGLMAIFDWSGVTDAGGCFNGGPVTGISID